MLADYVGILIVISIVLFILSFYTTENNPMVAVPIIILNIIVLALIAYGFVYIEWFYIAIDGTPSLYGTTELQYYSYVFVLLAFLQSLFFIRAGWNLTQEALKTKGEIPRRL